MSLDPNTSVSFPRASPVGHDAVEGVREKIELGRRVRMLLADSGKLNNFGLENISSPIDAAALETLGRISFNLHFKDGKVCTMTISTKNKDGRDLSEEELSQRVLAVAATIYATDAILDEEMMRGVLKEFSKDKGREIRMISKEEIRAILGEESDSSLIFIGIEEDEEFQPFCVPKQECLVKENFQSIIEKIFSIWEKSQDRS